MRTWTIEGADKDTGEDRVITVEAVTEAEAAKQAGAAGLLVSSMRELPPAPPPKPIQTAAVRYESITKGSRTLDTIATIAIVIGILFLIVAGFEVLAAAAQAYTGLQNNAVSVSLIVSSFMSGISLLIVAAFIRMLAAMALAIRDIAVNSFR